MSHPVKSGPWWDDIRVLLERVSFHDNALASLPGLEPIEGFGRNRDDWKVRTTARVLERLVAEGEEILVANNGGLARLPRSIEIGRGILVRDKQPVHFVVEVTELGDVKAHLEDPPGAILRSAVLAAVAAAVAALLVVVGISVLGDSGISFSVADEPDETPIGIETEVAGATEVPDPESDADAQAASTTTSAAPTTTAPTPASSTTSMAPPTDVNGATLTATGVLNGTELVLAGAFPSRDAIETIADIAVSHFGAEVVVDHAFVDERVAASHGGQIVIEDAVMFDSGSIEIGQDDQALLDQTAAWMRMHPAVTVNVSAHSDDEGPDDFNQLLSEFRAQSVKNYLVGQGADGDRITAVGYGETVPVVPNDNDAGLAQNRRIELFIRNVLA